MNVKKVFSALLVAMSIFWCFGAATWAVQIEDQPYEERILPIPMSLTRAYGTFNMDIPAGRKARADTSFHLDAGETVTINASYTPSGSVDFGLVCSDNKFYSLNTQNGTFNNVIRVSQRGYYTLQVRNNSSSKISVSGTVRY